jgi:hypothetical protein
MNRYPRGEPIQYEPDLDLVDDDDDRTEFELGQAWREFVALGRIGIALSQAAPRLAAQWRAVDRRDEPGVIDMIEVAPGVFARKKNPSPARGGPLGRIGRIQRAFARRGVSLMADDHVLRPDQHMADLMDIKSRYTEEWIRTQVSPSLARFYVLMEQIGRSPVLTSLLERSGAGKITDIDSTRLGIEALAKTIAGLDSGALELVAWTPAEGVPASTPEINAFNFGVWKKGEIAKHGEPGTMNWVPVPVLVKITAAAVTFAGAYLMSLYLTSKNLQEKADAIRAETESRMQSAIAAAPPADRAGLASAFDQAQRAAQSAANQGGKGWLSSIGQGLGDLATAAVQTTTSLIGSAESWLPWVLGGWVAVSVLGSLSNIFGGRRCCD